MKPKAWLKSLNTNFFAMASRPAMSDQPASLAKAALRASAVNFCAMIGSSCNKRRDPRNGSAAILLFGWRSRPYEASMSWSLNIGRVAGTVVRVHLTFLLFLAWIFAASYAQSGGSAALDSLVFLLLLFLCVLLHEFGHIFTARAFGVPTSYVTLLPIGGVAQLDRIPEEPGQEFL